MWNQDKYLSALNFAAAAHADQKVKGSQKSYVTHITAVAMEALGALLEYNPGCDFTVVAQAALLHDVIEDTAVTSATIESEFGEDVKAIVLALTKDESLPKGEQMGDSLKRIKAVGTAARIIKMADRIVNLQPPPASWSLDKCQSYKIEAQMILATLGGVHPVLEERFERKIKEYIPHE